MYNLSLYILILCFFSLNVWSLPHDNINNIADEDDVVKYSVIYNSSKKSLEIKEGKVKPCVAYTAFKKSMNESGWGMLIVSTNASYDDILTSEAAGMLEGYATADYISMYYKTMVGDYCENDKEFCDKLKDFISNNEKWMIAQAEKTPDSFWYQVSLVYKQLEGMYEGYTSSKVSPALSLFDFKLLNMFGDLEDLEQALGKKFTKKVIGSGSCSAMVKLFPKNADIGISQVTWNDYSSMLRIYKRYNFTFHQNGKKDKLMNGQVQSFSSYPGMIFSGDDFNVLSSGLVTQETTIGNSNAELWKYVTPSSVLEYIRAIVANRLADTGMKWCSMFERYNSGTYNNQWMILDYKRFTPGKELQPDTLWVLEQIPGAVQMADMTIHLKDQGYWSSYNLPYFPYIYNQSGVTASKKKFGSWFDYELNPRSQIFRRDHNKVVDMQTFVKLMRYNDFKNDELSKCNCTPPYSAENAISARSDLNPKDGKYPFAALGHRKHGGTDCKATNFELSTKLSQYIVAGPTFDQQPPFQWSKTEWERPLGHPDIFHFEPRLLDWSIEDWTAEPF